MAEKAIVTGASMAVLSHNRLDNLSVLAIQRDEKVDIPYPNYWELPGGTIDPGESAVDCALRECYEELHVPITRDDVLQFEMHKSPQKRNVYYGFGVAYIAHERAKKLHLGDEGQACAIMEVDEFLRHPRAIIDHQERLKDFLSHHIGRIAIHAAWHNLAGTSKNPTAV